MANVFTRKSRFPRTQTLLDFKNIDVKNPPKLRILSPTRRVNPHPVGLHHQNIPSTSNYLIWHPDLAQKSLQYPKMTHHLKRVNFSCKYPEEFNYVKRPGEHPVVTYTENTISRQSYICPSRFPSLKPKYSLKGPEKKAVTGIVPNLVCPEYLPVIEK